MLLFLPIAIFAALLFFCSEATSHAYIGPGAGFAFISSFFVLFLTGILAFLSIITWPARAAIIYFKGRKIRKRSRVKRVVVLGLDGLDPILTTQFMENGDLPCFKTLKENGCFRPLKTTTPSMSPVAWSTFATGVNPGKHHIFDFFTRDPKSYMPVLSSAQISSSSRLLKLGPLKIPYTSTKANFLRKSTSFWKILGEKGVFSSIIRVPITFPPEKFHGASLSAMCTPDLLGTQGTFTLYTTEDPKTLGKATGGDKIPINLTNGKFTSLIKGPPVFKNGKQEAISIPFWGKMNEKTGSIQLRICKKTIHLEEGKYTPWIRLEFRKGTHRTIKGIVRFLVLETKPELKIYMTPVNIDPEKPALPISHPLYYSVILSKLMGSYATLGLAEDTWALNERVIDEDGFLKQSYDIFEERKKQMMDALKKNKSGVVACVFDTTDRILHMFFRYLSSDHPANKGKDTTRHKDAIRLLYRKMDGLLGEILDLLQKEDLLIVMSDHGFKPFKWGINLNSWLWKEGYLVLKDGTEPGGEWFREVDWKQSRAFAFGLVGIFLNIKGRERHGIVRPGNQRKELQQELGKKLESLWDDRNHMRPIRRAIPSQEILKGPYLSDAPDLIIGYEEGYRVSWNSAVGKITGEIIEDNTRSWSGDHSIDPDLVPGVFFSNWTMKEKKPSISDIAPTILSLFGLEKEGFHDGKVLPLARSH